MAHDNKDVNKTSKKSSASKYKKKSQQKKNPSHDSVALGLEGESETSSSEEENDVAAVVALNEEEVEEEEIGNVADEFLADELLGNNDDLDDLFAEDDDIRDDINTAAELIDAAVGAGYFDEYVDRNEDSDSQPDDFADASSELPTMGVNEELEEEEDSHDVNLVYHTNDEKPTSGSHISFLESGSDWIEAAVLAQQPKRSGTQKDWVDIDIVGETQPCSMNWCNVEQWKYMPSPETVVLLTLKDEMKQDVIEAKSKELERLEQYGTFEVVPFRGQETVSSRWVITEKDINGTKKIKARLVARGFEEDARAADIRTDSPTCKRYSLRLVLITASMYKWKINSLDVASAFLQSNEIEREIYMCPPKDVCSSISLSKS